MKKTYALIAIAIVLGIVIGAYAMTRFGLTNTGTSALKSDRQILFYRNPMGSGHLSPIPMKDEMGMDYIPVYADENAAGGTQGLVLIDPVIVQNIGVRTATVKRGELQREIRAPGVLTLDENHLRIVTTRVAGQITRLNGLNVGTKVREFTPLYEIASPELTAMLQEFLAALRYRESLSGVDTATQNTANQISAAARERLTLTGLSRAQMQRIENMQATPQSMPFDTPTSGVIIKKNVVEGAAVTAGTELFTIADMSQVWAIAEVSANDASMLHEGQLVVVTIQGMARPYTSRIDWIDPVANPETRSVKVRAVLDNNKGQLRPDMFATLAIQSASAPGLLVPKSAVLRSGKQDWVIIEVGKGMFQAREVQLAGESGDMYGIGKGLQQNDIIVVSAQFLLDSESKVREAIRSMSAAAPAITTP